MTGEHSRLLPASGAPSWGNCSGSALINAAAPDWETEDSRRGTAAHWICAEVLDNFRGNDGAGPLTCDGYVGREAPNGVIIDSALAGGAQVFVDDVLSACQRHGGLRSLLVEHRVHMPQIHAENWGTLDAALPLIFPGMEHPIIYLWDYKDGHRDNRAAGNLQLIDYMAGLVAELNIDGQAEQQIQVVLRIVQPHCYHADGPINEWTGKLSDLRAYWNQLADKAAEIMSGAVSMSSGIWCRDCPAVGKCATARAAAYNMFDYVNAPYAIDAMTGTELATERAILLRGVAATKARLEAVEDDLIHRVGAGEAGTGLLLQSKPGHLAWNVPIGQAAALALQVGVDANKPTLYTPTQVIGKVDKAMRPMFQKMLDGVTMRPAGKVKLINAADNSVAAAFKTRK